LHLCVMFQLVESPHVNSTIQVLFECLMHSFASIMTNLNLVVIVSCSVALNQLIEISLIDNPVE